MVGARFTPPASPRRRVPRVCRLVGRRDRRQRLVARAARSRAVAGAEARPKRSPPSARGTAAARPGTGGSRRRSVRRRPRAARAWLLAHAPPPMRPTRPATTSIAAATRVATHAPAWPRRGGVADDRVQLRQERLQGGGLLHGRLVTCLILLLTLSQTSSMAALITPPPAAADPTMPHRRRPSRLRSRRRRRLRPIPTVPHYQRHACPRRSASTCPRRASSTSSDTRSPDTTTRSVDFPPGDRVGARSRPLAARRRAVRRAARARRRRARGGDEQRRARHADAEPTRSPRAR